jgi:hypothetical protein
MSRDKEEKWVWMMDYCKEKAIPPAQPWAWKQAEDAYIESQKNKAHK